MNRITDLVKSKTESEYEEKFKALQSVDNATFEKEFFESLEENIGQQIDKLETAVALKTKIKEVSEIVSLSYIARKYFGKTRAWLYQRLNGNVVNGKVATLTDEQITKLEQALKDISSKIGSVSLR